jgi:hypothetical protein
MAVLETAVQTIIPTELLPFYRYKNYPFCTMNGMEECIEGGNWMVFKAGYLMYWSGAIEWVDLVVFHGSHGQNQIFFGRDCCQSAGGITR